MPTKQNALQPELQKNRTPTVDTGNSKVFIEMHGPSRKLPSPSLMDPDRGSFPN